ncbi:unnamed protein product [marine sediment metagenome]|uniref:Uroporphyrinogen decarboxylase (URO-D) domain-containing protein n=1 Tax=marine sediment metagenome TaxID=412755 RepID=X1PVA3_9ZZZZ
MSIERDSDVRRLIKACAYEEPDRVPNFEHYVMKRAMNYILGEDRMKKNIYSEEMKHLMYLYSNKESEEDFEYDADSLWQSWKHNLDPWFSAGLPPAENLELHKATGVDMATPMLGWLPAVRQRIPANGIRAYAQEGIVKGWEDLDKVKIPPPQRVGKRVGKQMELVDWYIEEYKNSGLGVGPECRSCFCNTYEVLGIENFMFKLYDDIKLVEYIMDIFANYSLQTTTALSERNIDCFWLDDDVCFNNGFMVSPKLIKELWVPRTSAMLKPIRDKGIPIYMHCCGNIRDLIPIIIDMGITAIQAVQPNCNDIYALKDEYRGKMAFIGNMDLAGVLSFGTPAEVVEDTKEHIDRLAPGGGYVVGSSHSITDDVPPENYIAMIETAQTYGKY